MLLSPEVGIVSHYTNVKAVRHKEFFAGLLCKAVEVVEIAQAAPLARTRSQNKSNEGQMSSQGKSTCKVSVEKYGDKITAKDMTCCLIFLLASCLNAAFLSQ